MTTYRVITNKSLPIGDGKPDIEIQDVIDAVSETNNYLLTLSELFIELDFDLFEVLGQRNLSGLIGEIFSVFLAKKSNFLLNNPHPDGRPDIIFCRNDVELDYFTKGCFIDVGDRKFPLKSALAPYLYGGIEVKCTIGDPIKEYRKTIREEYNNVKENFELYMPRVKYLKDLNWWAHHTHSSNLLGLYYDYYSKSNNLPQILAVFNSELVQTDWNKVSTGSSLGKKTSNTSLNKTGKQKMKTSCLCVIEDEIYIEKLQSIKVTIQ
ncbi:hypothetical protein SAMN05421670_1811 [Psychrobacillus psychrotolerans]|uniref:Uncharacterized protein n=1 Tax=Psychrobacillus psychrotolerans TaxID=126156 RepID=A0A1I5XZC9_9BACI|nr:hypothetical protein [Psychrobacillus psychrotolerans]SFQ37362.1 hypothetical protein SAMN05421670_1811 [Psychrobacillus psychrotolerans]